MLRYRDHSGGVTHKSLSRITNVSKLGTIRKVRGYRYQNAYGGLSEAVMVHGDKGTARFEGFLWGYMGEGPRGLITLLMRLGLTIDRSENIAYNVRRRETAGTDWVLTFKTVAFLDIPETFYGA